MFNMMKFIHWPETTFAGPEEPWIVNVLGESPFAEAIGDMAGRTVQSRRIVVRYLPGQQPVEPGQVLVLTDETSPNDTLPEDIGSGSVLIVGDRRNFLNEGGIVNFLLIDNRVRFEINLDEARKRNLDISSRLLQLAERVLNEAGDR